MRGTPLIFLGAASHVSVTQALYSTIANESLKRFESACRSRPCSNLRSLFVTGGATNGEHLPYQRDHGADSSVRWWRSQKRRAAQAAAIAAEEASERNTSVQARKHVLLAKGVLRRLRGWLSVFVDITTLKRLRQLRQARQSSWQHGGPIPARYRGLLRELREEIVAKPGLERRARRVNHELDSVALGRYLEAAYWSLEHDGKRVIDLLEESIAWRESVRAHRLRKEDVAALDPKGTMFVKGRDLKRRPVVYFRPALNGKLEGDANATLMVYTLERAIRLMPRGSWQYTIVIDCQGMGLSHLPPVSYISKMFKLLSHHYPMRLGIVLFTNVGPSVMLCWRVISPLLQRRTKDKMLLIPSTKLSVTSKYIHPSELLPLAGGQSSWTFDPETYFTNDAASL